MSRKNMRKMFSEGACPSYDELDGMFTVRIFSSVVPDMSKWSHRKVMHSGFGINYCWQNYKWGGFCMRKPESCEPAPSCVVLDYSWGRRNKWLTRRIRDYVRRVNPDLYVGSLNIAITDNRVLRLGYFTLERR